MGNYVTSKKDMKFPNQDALKTVQSLIDDADEALKYKSRKTKDSPIQEALAGAVGVGAGAAIGFAGLSAASAASGVALAGGLLGAGIAVAAAPAVILGGAGIGVASHIKSKKLREAKELTYMNAIAKQNAIAKALKEERDADKERIEYLERLNILLQEKIRDLMHDLGIA